MSTTFVLVSLIIFLAYMWATDKMVYSTMVGRFFTAPISLPTILTVEEAGDRMLRISEKPVHFSRTYALRKIPGSFQNIAVWHTGDARGKETSVQSEGSA